MKAGGQVYNARVESVKGKEAKAQGVIVGDVVTHVGNWKTQGAKAKDVVAQIVKHKARPLRLSFATPDSVRAAREEAKRLKEKNSIHQLGTNYTFTDRVLGIRFSKKERGETFRGKTYNVRISKVEDFKKFEEGISGGDYLIKVADWDAAGASVREVVRKIKKYRNARGYRRPMNLTIVAAKHEKGFEEKKEEDEKEAEAARKLAEQQRERVLSKKAAKKRAAARAQAAKAAKAARANKGKK